MKDGHGAIAERNPSENGTTILIDTMSVLQVNLAKAGIEVGRSLQLGFDLK
jgi:hypothetical protein